MLVRSRRFLAVLLVLAGCSVPVGPVALPPAPREPPPPPIAADRSVVAQGVVNEANRVRRAEGLVELITTDVLTRAAIGHARELAQRGVLDHTGTTPGRATMTERIVAEGGTWTAAAENLARTVGEPAAVPATTIRLWLGSAGHRRNLLNPIYTHTGVGAVSDAAGRWFIVQLYVRP